MNNKRAIIVIVSLLPLPTRVWNAHYWWFISRRFLISPTAATRFFPFSFLAMEGANSTRFLPSFSSFVFSLRTATITTKERAHAGFCLNILTRKHLNLFSFWVSRKDFRIGHPLPPSQRHKTDIRRGQYTRGRWRLAKRLVRRVYVTSL